jgi:hypothetical protein
MDPFENQLNCREIRKVDDDDDDGNNNFSSVLIY